MLTFLRNLLLSLLALPLLWLTGCDAPEAYAPDAVHIVIETGSPLMAVTAAYSLDGEARGAGGVRNARADQPLPAHEALHFEYLCDDLGGPDAEGRLLTLEIAAVDTDGTSHEAGAYTCTISFGDIHHLLLTEQDGRYTLIPLQET